MPDPVAALALPPAAGSAASMAPTLGALPTPAGPTNHAPIFADWLALATINVQADGQPVARGQPATSPISGDSPPPQTVPPQLPPPLPPQLPPQLPLPPGQLAPPIPTIPVTQTTPVGSPQPPARPPAPGRRDTTAAASLAPGIAAPHAVPHSTAAPPAVVVETTPMPALAVFVPPPIQPPDATQPPAPRLGTDAKPSAAPPVPPAHKSFGEPAIDPAPPPAVTSADPGNAAPRNTEASSPAPIGGPAAAAMPLPAAPIASSADHAVPSMLPSLTPTPSLPSAPAAAASPGTSPAAQVAPALLSLAHAPDGAQRMTLRLEPAELGHVEISIDRPADTAARVEITVQRSDTLTLLLRDQPQLQRALDQAGVPPEGRSLTFHLAPAPPATAPVVASSSAGTHGSLAGGAGNFGDPGAAGRGPAPARPDELATDDGTDPAALPMPPRWLRVGLDITA